MRGKAVSLIGCAVVLALLLPPAVRPTRTAAAPSTYYVDAAATGADNGSSWSDAYTDLQDALTAAVSSDEIWVAAGAYKPSGTGSRTATFQLKSGVAVYGGFAGTEATRTQRDWQAHLTVLSGDIDNNDACDAWGVVQTPASIVGFNSYHVVTGSGTAATAVLDGFTITAGQANGSSILDKRGGGLYNDAGNPAVSNVSFVGNTAGNSGGGAANYTGSTPAFIGVVFHGNVANYGGGMFSSLSAPTLTDVSFYSNIANYGGGLGTYNSDPLLTNVTFISNTATLSGGGMHSEKDSDASLTNVLFAGNAAEWGGGMVNDKASDPILTNVTFYGNVSRDALGGGLRNVSNSYPELYNCVLWGNTPLQVQNIITSSVTFYHTLIQDSGGSGGGWDAGLGTDGGGNIDADPLFLDPDGADNVPGTLDDNLRLAGSSPAVDAGDNGWLIASTDLDYHVRRVDMPRSDTGVGSAPIVDMGAYEAHVLFVDDDATGAADGTSWADAMTDLQNAFTAAGADIEIWVAEGLYKPGTGGPRTATFLLQSGVSVWGGFAGIEALRSERDWQTSVAVLSGDIDDNDVTESNGVVTATANITGTNVYHVVTGSSTNSTAILDGFTVTAGYATGSTDQGRGGGMYTFGGDPTVRNVRFRGNHANLSGGGIDNHFCDSALTDIVFSNNTANAGAGLYNATSNPSMTGITFRGNVAAAAGGGMYNWLSSPSMTNVIFSGNRADGDGGGLYNNGASPTLVNATFNANSAGANGGGIANTLDSDPILTNCILWGDAAVTQGPRCSALMSTASRQSSTASCGSAARSTRNADNYRAPTQNSWTRTVPTTSPVPPTTTCASERPHRPSTPETTSPCPRLSKLT